MGQPDLVGGFLTVQPDEAEEHVEVASESLFQLRGRKPLPLLTIDDPYLGWPLFGRRPFPCSVDNSVSGLLLRSGSWPNLSLTRVWLLSAHFHSIRPLF